MTVVVIDELTDGRELMAKVGEEYTIRVRGVRHQLSL